MRTFREDLAAATAAEAGLSGTVDGAGGIGGLLARSHGYSSGSCTYHNFYHSDGNGNVTALVNSGCTLQASCIYDPFGRYLAGTGGLAPANVMRFSSKAWVAFAGSTTSGLYYYGYRFYDPYLQRWIHRDPVDELADTASGLGQNRDNPRYNFFNRNCQHFADDFCWAAQNLREFGTPYDPGHSRRNRPIIRIP